MILQLRDHITYGIMPCLSTSLDDGIDPVALKIKCGGLRLEIAQTSRFFGFLVLDGRWRGGKRHGNAVGESTGDREEDKKKVKMRKLNEKS